VDISVEEYARARAEFRKFDTGGNFLFSRRDTAVGIAASLLAYLIFWKWWILIVVCLLCLDLTRKEGIREGYIYGFEFGMTQGYLKGRGYTDDFRLRPPEGK
jgi:hypothetical protein